MASRLANTLSDSRDVVVCAAGSMPGDLHKLWRTRDRKAYHVEYYPNIFIIDANGVIRYRHVRGPDMDRAVEELLKEAPKGR